MNVQIARRYNQLMYEFHKKHVTYSEIEKQRKSLGSDSNFHHLSDKQQMQNLDEFDDFIQNIPDYDWRERNDVHEWIDPVWTRMGN